LSAFQYGEDFRQYLESTGSTKGYKGECWSEYVWFDVDNEDDPQAALHSTRRLAGTILDRYMGLDDDSLLYFFSGTKGYHVGLPLCWDAAPSTDFNRTTRKLAEGIAQLAGVEIDSSIHDKVRLFRAPNSRHPKSGLHKLRLSHDELMQLTLDLIRELAVSPEPFEWPDASPLRCEAAAKDWTEAAAIVKQEAEIKARPRDAADPPKLNRLTREFICEGAEKGGRPVRLFSAAANLAEFGCPAALAHALLTEPALDSGLSPDEVFRQIECGLNHVRGAV
jgi:hypothetical protein